MEEPVITIFANFLCAEACSQHLNLNQPHNFMKEGVLLSTFNRWEN